MFTKPSDEDTPAGPPLEDGHSESLETKVTKSKEASAGVAEEAGKAECYSHKSVSIKPKELNLELCEKKRKRCPAYLKARGSSSKGGPLPDETGSSLEWPSLVEDLVSSRTYAVDDVVVPAAKKQPVKCKGRPTSPSFGSPPKC